MSAGSGERGAVTVTSAVLREWRLPTAEPGASVKEQRGRVLVVGGSTRTPGAVLLAAEAAVRCGAGKMQVATAAGTATAVAVALPESMVLPLPQTAGGAVDGAAGEDLAELLELVGGADAVLLGPGAIDVGATRELVRAVLPAVRGALVLDALALAALTEDPSALGERAGRTVLTPNPSELALTLRQDQDEVAADLGAAAVELSRRTGATVAAGGAESWIAAPDGRLWRDASGGAGLGVSGSGDVFAGLVAGLAARGADPAQAAVWAAHLHGRAGDRLAADVGRLGFLARELPGQVPRVLAEIEL
ncbi:NAD(P)H-hydrate dehydratase [Kineococcus sp. NUM-3379]